VTAIASFPCAIVFALAIPAVPQQPTAGTEIIREVRVHGNAAVKDEDVVKLAGIALGDPLAADSLKVIEKRLKDSGRFETIEVRKRYRSLDDQTDVAIVLLVHERPGVTSADPEVHSPSRPLRWLTSRLMFLPILSYADGYGFTYGGRVSTVDLLGAGERLSVPLTWGGTKRVALEYEQPFKHGPLTRVTSSVSLYNRENPRFRLDDQRVEMKVRAERQITRFVQTGIEASRASVSFGSLDDRIRTVGANAALDTRGDPAFPGNAVYFGAGWSALYVNHAPAINRYTSDARGYLRVVGQSVFAVRAQYFTADAALPPYERQLLGGASTLRGFRAGTFDGDRAVVTSAEFRVPITSVLSGAKLGLHAFIDAGKTVDFGQRLKDAEWNRGVGSGLFIIAPLVKITMDVAHGLDGGPTRFHLGMGFSF
jgi:outer membrane protein assembly factor BamA